MAGLGNESVCSDVLQRIIGNGGLTLVGIAATPIKHMLRLIAMTAELQLPFDAMITHHFPLDQASEALALMESGQCGKILFDIANTPPR
jgi:threonine dehydrogenase-like Zn-dependent dehydrogenase